MKVTENDVLALDIAGAEVSIPGKTLADLWIEKVRATKSVECHIMLGGMPEIGERSELGVFMGIVRGDDGDCRVYDLGEAPERMTWNQAMNWARKAGGDLPTRREQALLYANRAEGQFKAEYYWSNAQHESAREFAWYHYFDAGTQYYAHQASEYRARAVRRVGVGDSVLR